MLERLQKAVEPRTSSVALTAFHTAIRQQDEFKETAEDIRVRQEQESAERKEKARDEELRAQNSDHAVDVVVSESSDVDADPHTEQRGSAVDVEV